MRARLCVARKLGSLHVESFSTDKFVCFLSCCPIKEEITDPLVRPAVDTGTQMLQQQPLFPDFVWGFRQSREHGQILFL